MYQWRSQIKILYRLAFSFFFASTLLWSNLCLAEEAQEINQNPLTLLGASVKNKAVKPGEITQVIIDWELAEKHHAYMNQFKLKALNHKKLKILEFTVSPVVDFNDVVSKKIKEGTVGVGQMRAFVKVPEKFHGGEYHWKLQLTYQACTDDYCLFPKKIPLEVPFNIDAPPPVFDITALFGGEGSSQLFKKALKLGWLFTFLIVFLAGIITSFTPCLFPMIPITLAVLGTRKPGQTKLHGFCLSLTYVLGIAFTYSLLGVIAASTGALFGALLGHPVVVGFIAVVFTGMGLSMFGLFDLQPPAWVLNRLSRVKAKGEFLSAFLAGLVAGIVASPCVGPVLAGVLLYVATTKNVVLGFFLLFTFAMGLGLIFIVLGTFTHLVNKLPASGAWMNRIKSAFGVVMILMAAYFVYPVAKNYVTKNTRLADNSCKDGVLSNGEKCDAAGSFSTSYAKPDWKVYSDERLERANESGRPVIIDFQAEWCISCKELEVFTFSDKQVLELGKNFLWLKFDATEPSDELSKLRERYSIVGLPLILFYDQDGHWREELSVTGFEKAEPFLSRMKKIINSD